MSAESSRAAPILVPVDFSPASRAALVWAAGAAQHFAASLEILHVVHDPESAPGTYHRKDSDLRSHEEAAGEMMDAFVEDIIDRHADWPSLRQASRTLVVGLPVNRILEVAEKRDAQLIVMGSLGRTGLPKLLLGSKAQRVVQLAPMPVTIVKADRAEVAGAGQ